jgi:hypothetical protein
MAKKAKQTQKYFDDQFDDEEVLFVFRKHPVVMRKGLIIGSLGILAPQLYILLLTYIRPPDQYPTMTFFFGSLVVGVLLALLLFAPSWINWYYSVFIVTDQRLIQITQKGFFHRSVVDLGLAQIQSINYEVAGLQATLLGFGTILIQTYIGDLVIHDVHHPGKIQKKLSHVLREQGVMAADYPSVPQESEASEEETT